MEPAGAPTTTNSVGSDAWGLRCNQLQPETQSNQIISSSFNGVPWPSGNEERTTECRFGRQCELALPDCHRCASLTDKHPFRQPYGRLSYAVVFALRP